MMFSQPLEQVDIPESDRQTLQDLLDLLKENKALEASGKFPLRAKSTFLPSLSLFPTIQVFFNTVYNDICKLPTNITYGQNLQGKDVH